MENKTKNATLLEQFQNQILKTLCDKVCQWLATGWWFSPGPPVSSTNKTDNLDIAEILLKVELKHHDPNPKPNKIHEEWKWNINENI